MKCGKMGQWRERSGGRWCGWCGGRVATVGGGQFASNRMRTNIPSRGKKNKTKRNLQSGRHVLPRWRTLLLPSAAIFGDPRTPPWPQPSPPQPPKLHRHTSCHSHRVLSNLQLSPSFISRAKRLGLTCCTFQISTPPKLIFIRAWGGGRVLGAIRLRRDST